MAARVVEKIPLHHQLTDLGMQPGDLAVAALLPLRALLVKHLGQLLDRLAPPGGDLGRMQFVLGRQLRNRLVALNGLKRNLGLELSRKPSPRL